jgi:hypothetical protein
MRLSNLFRNEQLSSKGEGSCTGISIGGRSVRQLYFQTAEEACFRDTDNRLWYYSATEKELSELIPRNCDLEAPIPREVWEAFGSLLGHVILNRTEEGTSFQQKEEEHE